MYLWASWKLGAGFGELEIEDKLELGQLNILKKIFIEMNKKAKFLPSKNTSKIGGEDYALY